MDGVKLTGLWKTTTRNGGEMLRGHLGASARLLIFKNDRKRGEQDPDYVAYIVPAEKREEGEQG